MHSLVWLSLAGFHRLLDTYQPLDNSDIIRVRGRVACALSTLKIYSWRSPIQQVLSIQQLPSSSRPHECIALALESLYWPSFIFSLATAAPQLAFPINSQVPPVAYASEPYNFVFAATTFVSSAPQISYTIADGPKWLDIDDGSRQFSGVPREEDIGPATFQLIASDPTGQTSTSVTFVVAASSLLSANKNILPQLGRSGVVSAPSSLLLHPREDFELVLDENTFSGVSPGTTYYAVSADNTPLPSWLQFSTTQLSFSGTAPVSISPQGGPQNYGLRLIASDVPGFAEAAVEFNIVINQRVLGFSTDASQDITISPGVPFRSSPLRSSLTLDGQPVANDQVARVDADSPSWLEFDRNQLLLSGTPENATNATITIRVIDIYGDIADATVFLQSTDDRNMSLGIPTNLNITAGTPFSSSTATASTSTHSTSTQTLPLASATGIASNPTTTPSGSPKINKHVLRMILGMVFSFVGAFVVVFLILWYLRRRRKHKQREISKPFSEDTHDSYNSNTMTEPAGRTVLSSEILGVATTPRNAPPRPPRLDLAWSNDSVRWSKQRLSGIVRPGPLSYHQMSQTFTEDPNPPDGDEYPTASQGILRSTTEPRVFTDGALPQQSTPVKANRISTKDPVTGMNGSSPQHPATAIVNTSSTEGRQSHNRSSTRMSRQSLLPPLVGLPDRRSGVGHGAGILPGSADINPSRASWRNTWTSNPSTDPRRTTIVLDSFPVPPLDGSEPSRDPFKINALAPVLRVVSEDGDEVASFEEQRQRWHTERARARLEGASRFSNAGSTQVMPSAPTLWRVRSDMTESRTPSPLVFNTNANISPREPSWTKWSGVGPAAHEDLQAGNPSSYTENGSMLKSRPSVASSGQFESVTSSDSQWEDEENLVIEETEQGNRQWQADSSSQASPRLPFSPVPPSRENLGNRSASDHKQQTRVADRRKHISVEEGKLKRSYGSHRGSFRFI